MIRNTLIDFVNKYINELSGQSPSSSDILNIEQFLSSSLEEEPTDSKTLRSIALIFKNLIFTSLHSFLTCFDQNQVLFIQKLLIKSIHVQDNFSQISLVNTLDSILLLTSDRVPDFFVSIFCTNFDISIFFELLNNPEKSVALLTIQCISNFFLAGFAKRILSFDGLIGRLLEGLEKSEFELKQEIVFCLSNAVEVSPIDFKVSFLCNRDYLSTFCDMIPTFIPSYIINILKSLLQSVSQCAGVQGFEDIKSAFLSVEFFSIFDSIDCENDPQALNEISKIQSLFLKLFDIENK